MTDAPAPPVRSVAKRLRYALAAITVVGALLAISAFYKSATCTCDGPGVPYTVVGWVAVAATAVSCGAYLAAGRISDAQGDP